MKKITTLLLLSIAFQSFAIDRFVNPNLSAGNGTTLFTNITSAINAAVNGDRIIVTSGTYNEAAITIGKSLQIMPQTPGTTINFNANITIAGFPGMKLEITGFNLGVYSFGSSLIASGSYINRAKIAIIDCNVTSIDINNDYYDCNIIKNIISQSLNFRYGNIVLNSVNNISLLDEGQDNPSGTNQKILITNNTISDYIFIYNNDSKLIIANNTIVNGFYLKRWYSNSSYKNKIMNNQFATNGHTKLLVSTINVPVYNLIFTNNVGNLSFYCGGDSGTPPFSNTNLNYNTTNTIYLDLGWYYTATSNQGLTTSLFPSNDVNGVFEWSYNGILLPRPAPTGNQPLSFINITGNGTIDSGNPNHDYYDIDLTINDRGLNGGPYSQLNYNAANPNNSKAFIFDLDMPSDLFPNQNVEIKSKGYHKN
jgi:hypothetical protein